jgi:hypothetical protein
MLASRRSRLVFAGKENPSTVAYSFVKVLGSEPTLMTSGCHNVPGGSPKPLGRSWWGN